MINYKILLLLVFLGGLSRSKYDLTIVGPLGEAGIQRIGVGFIQALKDILKINCVPLAIFDLSELSYEVKKIIEKADCSAGKVALFTDPLWTDGNGFVNKIPKKSSIKLAYSVHEATAIPDKWVKLLNNHFDGVVVADDFFVQVYAHSGVNIPIFVVPHVVCIEDLVAKPLKKKKNAVFTFGISAGYGLDKNHELVLEAFAQEFGNDSRVFLRLHGPVANEITVRLEHKVYQYGLHNVEVIGRNFTRSEYVKFLSSLDSYVLLSKGEGFSMTPREAMALGIPCVLANHTAHITLCNTGLPLPVEARTVSKTDYGSKFGKNYKGLKFDVSIDDARKALRTIYTNYEDYLSKADQARKWSKQYSYANLQRLFLNLIKPSRIILGTENKVTNTYLMTNSYLLYQKYQNL